LLLSPSNLAWLVLMLATCTTTWWLSKDTVSPAGATVFILVVAAVKVRLVLAHFMGLRHAPIRWRLLFEAWIVVCTAIILSVYLQPVVGAVVAGSLR
jgi:heme/copper-type cytochrome/quinol oxidase subunit 4